jgi:hypothetical protein
MGQSTNHVFLVRPKSFGFNSETAASNSFQNNLPLSSEVIYQQVIHEFNAFAEKLSSSGINVTVFDDTLTPAKPDAIFPNNWISCHADGTMVLYPMCTPNRRQERREDIIEALKKKFSVTRVMDLSPYEKENRFLEGTGSIIFDHVNRIAYACGSPRTDQQLFEQLMKDLGYEAVFFHAENEKGIAIYHTNVMMCAGDRFTVICLESISDPQEKRKVKNSLLNSNHEIIDISFSQMNSFAGNMLLLKGTAGNVLALSQSAYDSLTTDQKKVAEHYCELLPLPINTIETIGGGGARCMIAEIFFPAK